MHYISGFLLGIKENIGIWFFWYNEYVLKSPEQREQENIESKRKLNTVLAQLGIMSVICSNLGSDYYE